MHAPNLRFLRDIYTAIFCYSSKIFGTFSMHEILTPYLQSQVWVQEVKF
jgi:hypothetical protein